MAAAKWSNTYYRCINTWHLTPKTVKYHYYFNGDKWNFKARSTIIKQLIFNKTCQKTHRNKPKWNINDSQELMGARYKPRGQQKKPKRVEKSYVKSFRFQNEHYINAMVCSAACTANGKYRSHYLDKNMAGSPYLVMRHLSQGPYDKAKGVPLMQGHAITFTCKYIDTDLRQTLKV